MADDNGKKRALNRQTSQQGRDMVPDIEALAVVKLSKAQIRAWEKKRHRALDSVKTAIKSRNQELLAKHPLRSFGVNMVVCLLQHTPEGKQRKLVVMSDSLRYTQWKEWLNNALYGKSAPKNLTVHFVNDYGTTMPIENATDYAGWLDLMWYRAPPELFVFELEALVLKAEKKWSAAEELFRMYDVDGNGKIDLSEMLMARQMTEILDVPRHEVMAFMNDLFQSSDVDKDSNVSFPEFVAFFNHLADNMREGLVRESKPSYRRAQVKASSLSARSWRVPLGTIAKEHRRIVIDDNADAIDLVAVSRQRGWLECHEIGRAHV